MLILAGGEATRLPEKLHLAAGRMPMLARAYRNVSLGRATFPDEPISANVNTPADDAAVADIVF